ncbi:hypothetical protein N7478_011000 [Penicillium angulare]|uniref:uncharacterized protein n=1 Tax=Penicillium angulare TaxID=116970 RepID=UPI0025407DBD|nr:uncharacterized protein N7478_011000 [Penicillium angulare]KAJ5263395.1 hypothetical protein N7478_011000 [Penicillium angulare]
MSRTTLRLGDVLCINIPEHEPMRCLAKIYRIKKNVVFAVKCQNQIARKNSRTAHRILQHKMSFRDEEHDVIEKSIAELVDLLIHGNWKHNDSQTQKENLHQKWLDLWHARIQRHREMRQIEASILDLDIANRPEYEPETDVSKIEDHIHEITHVPAIIQYPTLQLEPGEKSTHEHNEIVNTFFSTRDTTGTDVMEHKKCPIKKLRVPSFSDITSDDGQLPSQVSLSTENLGLDVSLSTNQQHMINYIISTIWRLCAVFQLQHDTILSRDDAGNPQEQSIIQFKMLLGARFPLPRFQDVSHIIIPFTYVLSQFMCIFLGPSLSFTLVFVAALGGWCWSVVRPKKLQNMKTE